MLGQPLSMLLPEVVGFKLKASSRKASPRTDLVLTVTQMLRKQGVVGKFVEIFRSRLDYLSVADKGHDRQHGAGIWRDLRLLPGRCRDHRLSEDLPAARPIASRWL